jgi:uncharacterized protein (TIGR01244 family)
VVLVVLAWAVAPAVPAAGAAATSDPRWATRLSGGEDLPNLYQVSPVLLRGAQPALEGFAALKALGVRTVINVRAGRHEGEACERAGLRYVEIPMRAWRVDERDVVRFLEVIGSADHAPVFVHCRRGADRTGMLVAVYRVAVEGWSKEDALAEMTRGPYGFNPAWTKLVRFVEDMDVDRLRRAAALDSNGGSAP